VRSLRLAGPVLTSIALTAGLLVAPAVTAGPTAYAAKAQRVVPQVRVSVMTQNIFYGGDDYDLATGGFCPVPNGCPQALHRLAHVIKVSGADVVGVQEAENNTRRLADLLGWYSSPRAHVISRFPILDPPHSAGVFTYVEPVPGRVIAVANTHLPSTPYGPYRVRAGWSRQRVLHLERTLRVPALKPVLNKLPRLAAKGIPVFLTGDFNSPSYLDWTPAAARKRKLVPYALKWPASRTLADAGFRDSYREIHPNPVKDPGFTWSPGGPETRKYDFSDRIDWVLHSGPSTAVSSKLLGERGDHQADITFHKPYPTDHRGVVSTFELTPAPAPIMVSPGNRRVITGPHRLHVRFHAHGLPGEVIGLLRAGRPHRLINEANARGRRNGVVSIRTTGLKPGRYDVALRNDANGRVEATAPVWVYRPDSHSHVRAERPVYRVGSPITIGFTRAPGNNLDWVGIYRCHRTCGSLGSWSVYGYTRTKVEGSVRFGPNVYLGEGAVSWPLPPGQYAARLLLDDGYRAIGMSPRFRIAR
jgi:endonuclease/exonuclease/phosphatase family metal-dependent hydrolase